MQTEWQMYNANGLNADLEWVISSAGGKYLYELHDYILPEGGLGKRCLLKAISANVTYIGVGSDNLEAVDKALKARLRGLNENY